MKTTIKSELIEVLIPANNLGTPKTKIQLPDNQNLRFSELCYIQTYYNRQVPLSWVTKTPVISRALLQSIALTLQDYNGLNFQWQSPLIDFLDTDVFSFDPANPTTEFNMFNHNPEKFDHQKVNYPKSYIEIADSTLISVDTQQTVLLKIFYRESAEKEKKQKEASFNNKK